MSSFQEEFLRRQKQAKEEERERKKMAAAAQASYRGTANDVDKALEAKKLKEQDRLKKQQAQDMMRSYQDVKSVEEMQEAQAKKAAMRQKQLDHEKAMQSYKAKDGTVDEHELRLRKQRQEERERQREAELYRQSVQLNDVKYQKKERTSKEMYENLPPVERMKHDDDDLDLSSGHVKDIAGLFHHEWQPNDYSMTSPPGSPRRNMGQSPNKQQEYESDTEPIKPVSELTANIEEMLPDIPVMPENLPPKAPKEKEEQPDEELEMEATTEINNDREQKSTTLVHMSEDEKKEVEEPIPTPTMADEQVPKEPLSLQQEPEPELAHQEKHLQPEPAQEATTLAPPQPEEKDVAPSPEEPTPVPEPDKVPPVPNLESESATVDSIAAKRPLKGHKTKVRLDVLFSFGLLTSSDKPYLDNYMMAVARVVQDTISESDFLTKHVRYDSTFPPFVQEYAGDATYQDPARRAHVKRVLVVAAIPIFLSNGISIKEAREGICSGLQAAMQNGSFITIAKRGSSPKKNKSLDKATPNKI